MTDKKKILVVQKIHEEGMKLIQNNPNFDYLAKSFGLWGKELKSCDELIPALEEASKQKGPAIIGIPVDYNENMRLTQRLGKVSANI